MQALPGYKRNGINTLRFPSVRSLRTEDHPACNSLCFTFTLSVFCGARHSKSKCVITHYVHVFWTLNTRIKIFWGEIDALPRWRLRLNEAN